VINGVVRSFDLMAGETSRLSGILFIISVGTLTFNSNSYTVSISPSFTKTTVSKTLGIIPSSIFPIKRWIASIGEFESPVVHSEQWIPGVYTVIVSYSGDQLSAASFRK